jgi:hypothetical protein
MDKAQESVLVMRKGESRGTVSALYRAEALKLTELWRAGGKGGGFCADVESEEERGVRGRRAEAEGARR